MALVWSTFRVSCQARCARRTGQRRRPTASHV